MDKRKAPKLRCFFILVHTCVDGGAGSSFFHTRGHSEFLPESTADKAAVIEYGMIRMGYMSLTYFLCGLMEVMSGMLRGLGASMTSMLVSLVGACGLRVVWIYTIFSWNRTPGTLYLSFPLSWFATTLGLYICYAIILRRIECKIKTPPLPPHPENT